MENIWCCYGAVDSDGYLWIPAHTYNGLYKCNFDLKTVELVCTFEHEEPLQVSLYGGIRCVENQIILTPQWTHEIAVYEKDKCKVKYYNFPSDAKLPNNRYFSCILYEDNLYFIPLFSYMNIIRLDRKNERVCNTGINLKIALGWENDYTIDDSIMISRHLYILVKENHAIIDVDMKKNTVNIINIRILADDQSAGLLNADGQLWFYIDNFIYLWDAEKDSYSEIKHFPDYGFRKMSYCDGKIYGFVSDKPMIYVYNIETEEADTIIDTSKEISCLWGWKWICPLDVSDNQLICISYYSGELLRIEGNEIVERMELKGEMPEVDDTEAYDTENTHYEGYHEKLRLSDFLDHIEKSKETEERMIEENIGKKIVEEIVIKDV